MYEGKKDCIRVTGSDQLWDLWRAGVIWGVITLVTVTSSGEGMVDYWKMGERLAIRIPNKVAACARPWLTEMMLERVVVKEERWRGGGGPCSLSQRGRCDKMYTA